MNENRPIYKGTLNKHIGMYIGEQNNPSCKENRNILITMVPTDDYNDTITIKTPNKYKKRTPIKNNDGTIAGYHEIGDYKYKKILKKYPSKLTPNLKAAWMTVSDYPTVSYGLCNWRRDALIIDSDEYYENVEQAKQLLDKMCKVYRLPEVSYVLRNPSSGHIQAGWLLCRDAVFQKYEFPKFNSIIKGLARAYSSVTGNEADICFNGPACKNPFYKGFESIITNEMLDSIEEFEALGTTYAQIKMKEAEKLIYNKPSSSPSYNNTVDTAVTIIKSTTSKKGYHNHYFGNETSRDYLECKWFREWIWSEMRNDRTPTYQEARTKMNEFAEAAAKQTNKPLHSTSELNSKTDCTYRWAVSHFKTLDTNNNKGTFFGADFGRFVQKLQSFVLAANIMKYKEETNKSYKEIAQVIGCGIATAKRAKSIVESYDNIACIDAFNTWFNTIENNALDCYRTLYEMLKETKQIMQKFVYKDPLSSPSYNNTVDTAVSISDKTTNQIHKTEDYLFKLEALYKLNLTWNELNSIPYNYNLWKSYFGVPKLSDFAHYKSKDTEYLKHKLIA